MAQQISLGTTNIIVGPQQFLIDGLPDNSIGWELVLGVNSSWTGAVGKLFDFSMAIALTPGQFRHWISFSVFGGPVVSKTGANLTTWRAQGLWPGQVQGVGRQVLRATDLRIDVQVAQAFSVPSLLFHSI